MLPIYVLDSTDESTGVLKKAESEYKGHRSLLSRTRNLLSTMQRQDVLDRYIRVKVFLFPVANDYICWSCWWNVNLNRLILAVGFFLFSCAVLYVVSKRIGILTLQRKVTAAIKVGIVRQADLGHRAVKNGINHDHVHKIPLERVMHDELWISEASLLHLPPPHWRVRERERTRVVPCSRTDHSTIDWLLIKLPITIFQLLIHGYMDTG